MKQYFKNLDAVQFMKGFENDSFEQKTYTGDVEEITEREFLAAKENLLDQVKDELKRGYYLVQEYTCIEDDEVVETFYEVIGFIKNL